MTTRGGPAPPYLRGGPRPPSFLLARREAREGGELDSRLPQHSRNPGIAEGGGLGIPSVVPVVGGGELGVPDSRVADQLGGAVARISDPQERTAKALDGEMPGVREAQGPRRSGDPARSRQTPPGAPAEVVEHGELGGARCPPAAEIGLFGDADEADPV